MAGAVGLGAFLRDRREAKGLSVADLSDATRIAPRLLDALEQDRLEALPAPVFVRGFVRAYCAAVDEPADHALQLYEDSRKPVGEPAPPVIPAPAPAPRPAATPPHAARPVARPVLVAASLGVVLGGVVAYLLPLSGDTPHAAAPAPQADTPPAVTALAAGPASLPVAAPSAPADAVAASPRVLVMRAHDTTWVQVRADNAPPSQALLQPGTVREWRSPGRFTVTVGNAGGVVLELDGVALPPLGRAGQVVRGLSLPAEPRS